MNMKYLLRKDMDGYARNMLKLGETLAEHHVPLHGNYRVAASV